MAQSLYRKYRPQVFGDVVGQEHVERTLMNAVAEDNVSHAYLFCGPRGTGKTTTARLLAKALMCTAPKEQAPDGTCEECRAVAEGRHPDVYELDAASRTGVENVRTEIIERVTFAPVRGRYKIYIIDEVHMLSQAAFNALLKTLEEPPAHVIFIMCTTDPQKVPATVLSRCQRFDFHRFTVGEIVGRLRFICTQEAIEADSEALTLIARHAQGGMRDAISSLEQLAAFTGNKISRADAEGLLGEVHSAQLFDICSLIAQRDVAGCFKWIANFTENGTDMMQFARDLTAHVRNLYVTSLTGGSDGIVDADEETLERYRRQAAEFEGPDRLTRMLVILGDLLSQLRTATDPRLCVEIAFTRMARPESDLTLDSLAERVERVEARLDAQAAAGGVQAQPVGHAAQEQPQPVRPAAQAQPSQSAAQSQPVQPAAQAQQSQSAVQPQPVAQAQTAQPAAQEQAARSGVQAEPVQVQQAQNSAQPRPSQPAPSGSEAVSAADVRSTRSDANVRQQAAPSTQPTGTEPRREAAGDAQPQTHGGQGHASVAGLTRDAAQRLWTASMKLARQQETALVGILSGTIADVDSDGTLVVRFPSKGMFSMKMAEQPEKREIIAGALRSVAGANVAFRFELAKRGSAAAVPEQSFDVPVDISDTQLGSIDVPAWDAAPDRSPAADRQQHEQQPQQQTFDYEPEEIPLDVYDADAAAYVEEEGYAPASAPSPAVAQQPVQAPGPASGGRQSGQDRAASTSAQPATQKAQQPSAGSPSADGSNDVRKPTGEGEDAPGANSDAKAPGDPSGGNEGGSSTSNGADIGVDSDIASILQGAFGGGVSFESLDNE
jgi:DNA polymerase-3 subunit gamma/tau